MAINKDLEYGLLAELSYVDFGYDSLSTNNPSGWKNSATQVILDEDDARNICWIQNQ
jgi:hypothetical protein